MSRIFFRSWRGKHVFPYLWLTILFLTLFLSPFEVQAEGTALQNCLCGCHVGKTNFSCTFDTTDRGHSPSCSNLSNGQCICKAFGCFRKRLPLTGLCRNDCFKKYGQKSGQATNPQPTTPAQGKEFGYDRPGNDFANFPVSTAHQCQAACAGNGRCKAWTFVKAGVQGKQPRCWLKSGVPRKVRSSCCISGARAPQAVNRQQPKPPNTDDPKGTIIPKHLFMQSVRFAIEKTERPGLSSRYFSVAEKERFLRTVAGWLGGVAEDREYLIGLNGWASYGKSYFWTQKLNMQGFAQPKGWTGFAQGLARTQSMKYNGWIILADFQPQNPATPFHEAIHAFAYAVGAGDLDNDDYHGPEFISNPFVSILGQLRNRDRDFCVILDNINRGQNVNVQIGQFEKSLTKLGQIYRRWTKPPQVEQLLHLMGGRADWVEYRTRISRDLDRARRTVAAGRRMEKHPACYW